MNLRSAIRINLGLVCGDLVLSSLCNQADEFSDVQWRPTTKYTRPPFPARMTKIQIKLKMKCTIMTFCDNIHITVEASSGMSRIARIFAYAKTKAQISFAVILKLISFFVFVTRIVQFVFFLNPNFQASSLLQRLYRPVCVGPGRKSRRPVFSRRGSYLVHVHCCLFSPAPKCCTMNF